MTFHDAAPKPAEGDELPGLPHVYGFEESRLGLSGVMENGTLTPAMAEMS